MSATSPSSRPGDTGGHGRTAIQDPVVDKIVAHVERVGAHGVPAEVRSAAKSLIADTLAVGVAGRSTPWRGEILDMLARIGGAGEATVFGSGERLPLVHASMLNAYQIHGQEFDCVHDAAVVHPMAAVLPVLLGWAEREGGVSGALLLRAIVLAVDVAATLGLCSRAPMRFFRPANAGGFGATIGLAMLAGLDADRLRDAMGIYYGQCAGTMQAHSEGAPQLANANGICGPQSSSRGATCRDLAPPLEGISAISRCLTVRPIRCPLRISAHLGASLKSATNRFPVGARRMGASMLCSA